ncbi:MAG: Gfo/Idh/MocA family oxidoreductase [Flavobacteriales bacterium]|nr:Gfo/Idh/MocA family oxidoreductase [Flavobacteriales bacterium]
MNERIRIGVLGAGHLGRIHVQQLLEVPAFELVGFHDPHPEKCEALHKEFGATVFPNAEDLLAQVDVVDIVTPTLSHFKLAKAALERGSHVFIEKPVTNTVEEARELVALAKKVERVVQVGHVERFNPAFQAALPYFKDPMFIESHRLAQFNPRGTDVSVVLDLMIHDIDIIQSVVQSPVAQVSASGVAVVSDTPDIANARIEFANGCVANLTASRISLKNMRKCRFFQRDAYISVDMLTKETEVVRMRTVHGEPDPFAVTIDLGEGKGSREIAFEKPEIPKTNAIREELTAFAKAIQDGSTPVVTIEQASAALETAHQVLAGMVVRNS